MSSSHYGSHARDKLETTKEESFELMSTFVDPIISIVEAVALLHALQERSKKWLQPEEYCPTEYHVSIVTYANAKTGWALNAQAKYFSTK